MKHELRQMRSQGSGAIVNCSSIGGLIGLPGRAVYHASKHGVLSLTKSAALEYATQGIRVNAVCPGTTPMVSLRTPRIVWMVRIHDDLYTRSVNGPEPPGSTAPEPLNRRARPP